MKPKLVEFLNAGKVFPRTNGFILEDKLKGRPLTLDRRDERRVPGPRPGGTRIPTIATYTSKPIGTALAQAPDRSSRRPGSMKH